jgi:hypothetical protein
LTGVRIVADDDAEAFAQEVVQLVSNQHFELPLGKQAHQAAVRWNDVQREQLHALLAEANKWCLSNKKTI